MTEERAQKIVNQVRRDGYYESRSRFYYAKGYLRVIKKAKGLEEFIREQPCHCAPDADHICFRCEVLVKWEKKK